MRQITITEALNQLKLYDSKIMKGIEKLSIVGSAKEQSDKIGHKTKETYKQEALASYQSLMKLIENRDVIKSKIVLSNATTNVLINGVEYSVAEAIEKKNSITYRKNLHYTIADQLRRAIVDVDLQNKKVDKEAEALMQTLIGKDSGAKQANVDGETLISNFTSSRKYGLVDPIDAEKVIAELNNEIEGFLSSVDTALVVSNSTTMVEIDD